MCDGVVSQQEERHLYKDFTCVSAPEPRPPSHLHQSDTFIKDCLVLVLALATALMAIAVPCWRYQAL